MTPYHRHHQQQHQHHHHNHNHSHSYSHNNNKQTVTLKHIICTSLSVFISLLVLIGSNGGNTFALAESVDSALKRLKVYPDVVAEPVYSVVNVDLLGNSVKPGDIVSASKFKDLKPEKITWDADSGSRHSLILLDLDNGKAGPQAQFNNSGLTMHNQYTSINIQGNSINSGTAIVGYDAPRVPCAKGTKHRMLLLALAQPQLIDLPEVYAISAPSGQPSIRRESFKLKEFLLRHNYDIVAANVFLAAGEIDGVCSSATSQSMMMMNHFSLALLATLVSLLALRGSDIRQQLISN